MPNRIHKQCRERWNNILSPGLVKKRWTPEEDREIVRLYYTFGPRWARIATRIDGRNDNQIKNRWNSNLKKRHSFNHDWFGDLVADQRVKAAFDSMQKEMQHA